jgi:putative FmdB family regulatory protein
MPFYEYQCKSCGHQLEAMQKVSDSPLKKCPDCGKSQLVRLMSAPVFRLKGGGWYETDFKGDKDNQRNLADRPEAADASKDKPAADSKTDTKPSETAAKESPAAPEKSADKMPEKSTAEKPSAGSAGKPAEKSPARGTRGAAARSGAKRAAKRPPAKVKRRR